MNQGAEKRSQQVGKIDLWKTIEKFVDARFVVIFIEKTYEVAADDVCETSGTELIEEFERVVANPPF